MPRTPTQGKRAAASIVAPRKIYSRITAGGNATMAISLSISIPKAWEIAEVVRTFTID
jgi:hypothetical protein